MVNAGVPLVPGRAGMPEPVPGVKDFHIGRQGDIWETVFVQEGLGGNAMRWRFHTAAGCRLRLKETSLDTGPTSGDRQDYPGGPVRGTRSSSFNSLLTRQQHQGEGLVLPIHSLVQSLNVHTMASHSTHIPLSSRVSVRPSAHPSCFRSILSSSGRIRQRGRRRASWSDPSRPRPASRPPKWTSVSCLK